jgi:hypothetical protein
MGVVLMDVKFKRVGAPKEANKETNQASQSQ